MGGTFGIILVDDHTLFRQAIRAIIEGIEDLEIIGEAGDGLELLALLKQLTPDLLILDIAMPRMRGTEAVYEVKAAYPEVKILVLTMYSNREYVRHAFSAGAEGYLLKEDALDELLLAIRAIRNGETYISPVLSGLLSKKLAVEYGGGKKQGEDTLSPREREVLKLIAEGATNREIARLLSISVHTVERHRANILSKLDIRGTAGLVRYAIEKGYLNADR